MPEQAVNAGLTIAQLGAGFTVDPVNKKINMKLTEAVKLASVSEWKKIRNKCPQVIYYWAGGFAIGNDRVI